MKVSVRVGAVSVTVQGVDYSQRQVRRLLAEVAGVAAAFDPEPADPGQALGFTAHLERLPDDLPASPEHD